MISRNDDWAPEPSLRLPTATSALYSAGDAVLALSTGELAVTSLSGVLDAAGAETDSSADESPANDAKGGWLAKLTNMMGGATDGFSSILPGLVSMTPPRGIVVDPEGRWLIAMTRGRLVRLQRPEDRSTPWTLVADRTLEGEPSRRGTIAVSGNALLVARNEEAVQIVDAMTFEPVSTLELPSSLSPVSAAGLGRDGRFLMMTSDGRCRELHPQGEDRTRYEISAPLPYREVESIGVDPRSGAIHIAHHIDRVEVLDPTDFSAARADPAVAGQVGDWSIVT